MREEVTANLCLGTKTAVRGRVANFSTLLADRKEEVKQRCRTPACNRVQENFSGAPKSSLARRPINVDSIMALV